MQPSEGFGAGTRQATQPPSSVFPFLQLQVDLGVVYRTAFPIRSVLKIHHLIITTGRLILANSQYCNAWPQEHDQAPKHAHFAVLSHRKNHLADQISETFLSC